MAMLPPPLAMSTRIRRALAPYTLAAVTEMSPALLARPVSRSSTPFSSPLPKIVMSPAPLDPKRAMLEAITSLEEQVKTRVTSVENGRKYQVTGSAATMPDGASILSR